MMVGKYLNPEYKDYLCRLVVEDKRKVTELARELNISHSTLQKWVGMYKKNQSVFKPQPQNPSPKAGFKTVSDFEKEIRERDKQIAKLEEQNAILKKAMHVFTQSPD